jgi:anti-anti-sigma factor
MDGSSSLGTAVVVLSGDLDASRHDAVAALLAAALADDHPGRPREIVVEMSAVRLLDAGTVRVLLQAAEAALDSGRRISVTGAHDGIRRVIVAAGAGHRLLRPPTPTDAATDAAESGATGAARDPATGDRIRVTTRRRGVADQQTRILARLQQRAIETEVRATRRELRAHLRERLRTDPRALIGEPFLAVADRPAVYDGIMLATAIVGAADACVLQAHDAHTGTLHVVRHHGLTGRLLSAFVAARPGRPAVPETAAATGEPIIVDDIARSPMFAHHPALDLMVAAGLYAVRSYPLCGDAGHLHGVLSFQYRTTRPLRGDAELVAWSAAHALTQLPTRTDGYEPAGGSSGRS